LGRFADAEDLAGQTDNHEQGSDGEGEPGHSVTFVPYLGLSREGKAGNL
jgi:hypothetical protein